MKKNDEIIIEIYDLTDMGYGVGRYEDIVIFVNRALPGDVILAGITKIKKNYAYARIIKIITESKDRVEPPFHIHDKCGGCIIQELSYKKQLEVKNKIVNDSIKKIAKLDNINILPIIGMDTPYHYRNKVQYPLTYVNGKIKYGFYLPHSHKVYPNESCLIQQKEIDKLMNYVCVLLNKYEIPLYDETNQKGYLRHVVIRRSDYNAQLMIAFVINSQNTFKLKHIVEELKNYSKLVSILANINMKDTNVILGDTVKILYGEDKITDSIGDKKYNLSLQSFFQVNNKQAKILYDKIIEFGELSKKDSVIDLYCGIGSIGIYIADRVDKVFGVEIVDAAIENAEENVKLNGINNAKFINADATEIVKFLKSDENYNCVIVDPPRRGLTEKLINDIDKLNVEKIIYVSCNPTTLARDLAIFVQKKFEIKKIQPVDLFPMTLGVETVALLCRKDINNHIEVKLELDEEDITKAESKGTYENIKEYVLDNYGFKVSTLYIAQIKKKCGLELGENYNKSKKENSKVPECPKEKEDAIMDALRHFGMIVQDG